MPLRRVAVLATALVLVLPTSGWGGPPAAAQEAAPTVTATQVTPSPVVAPPTLQVGQRGPAVLALQQRLRSLGYWLGTVDATFGPLTQQAVYAVQKASGLQRDGVVGPATTRALAAGVRPVPRSRRGRVMEVHLARQLLLVVQDGKVLATFNTSTGSGRTYVLAGRVERAVTPVGRYSVYRQVDGVRVSPLGRMWRPKYYSAGIAVHGYPSVPPWPASHGCVRVSDAGMDWIWASGAAPLGTPVWVL